MPRILAIDQSTSATKAVLFSENGAVLDKALREHRQIYPQPGWVEHDPEEIWQNTLAVICEVASRHNGIGALSITNQRETILVFDRVTGRPLHNAIVWQCARGDAICQELKAAGHDGTVLEKTGLKIDTYFSASKVLWLMRERPDIAGRILAGDAVVGTIDSYLVHRLTNGAVFATDFTNASRTLLFDVNKLRWDDELCALFSVPPNALPEVRESSSVFGTTQVTGREIPITGVMGDSQASLFAQRCFAPGDAKATFGTGTSVMMNIGSHFQPSKSGSVTALAWVHEGRPTYALEGLINFSAATLAWLKNQLGLLADGDDIEQIARSVEDNGGVYLVPAFAGLGAPHWNARARAAIHGMTAHTTRAHIVRAALESIAYQVRDILDMMRDETGVTPRKLHCDGGPTQNKLLMQFTADLCRTDLCVAEVAESSAWGAAMNALLGLGFRKSFDELAGIETANTAYRPAEPVEHLHAGWRDALRRVLG